MDINELAKKYDSWENSDKNQFQRRARILQSIWREEKGYPMGLHRGRRLGSRLAMPWAEEKLANCLTETIRKVVRQEIEIEGPTYGKLYKKRRIYEDLLSSQPLCFNLFAELKEDLVLAKHVFNELTDGRVQEVIELNFEYSPGRRSLKYTNDRTAFDVYIVYLTVTRKKGFIGIEVKYHENLGDNPSSHKMRYEEIAEMMGCFKDSELSRLKQKPLQQIWRDHLLAGSILKSDKDEFGEGLFVLLYPKDNCDCQNAIEKYQACLSNDNSFQAWTLENVSNTIRNYTQEKWIQEFIDRYLNFHKLNKY